MHYLTHQLSHLIQCLKKLNVIDGNTWKQSGQSLTYNLSVETSGLYQLAIKYMNDKADFNVLRSISIDGDIPFKEFRDYAIPTTKANDVKIHKFAQGDTPYYVYLSEGTHQITIKAESESLENSLRQIQQLIDHINAFSLEIRKITGKTVDKDRTWQFTQYIPETPAYLEAYQLLLKNIITELSTFAPMVMRLRRFQIYKKHYLDLIIYTQIMKDYHFI